MVWVRYRGTGRAVYRRVTAANMVGAGKRVMVAAVGARRTRVAPRISSRGMRLWCAGQRDRRW